ncbi:MAG TPA: ParA family protein [Candidatus Ventricola intestinavium]|nr:ParA family protein [Candidatus Ventricola intestinavium]
MARIIAITNQKGGVGKTTTSVNLSACVAAEGRRVLVVDADPQGNTSSGLGVRVREKTPTIYEVMAGNVRLEDALVKTAQDNLMLLPSDIRLAGAEIELADMDRREHVIAQALSPAADRFDEIFIDCPPSLGLITLNALCAADGVLIPIQCEYYALEGVSALMGTIQKVQRINRHLTLEGVVLTMLDARTNLGIQVAQEVRKVFKGKVYNTVIPRNVRLGEAPSHGLPIHLYDPRSLGAQSYQQLAREFLSRM